MNDELTDAQEAELHAALLTLRGELQASLKTTTAHAATVDLDQAAVGRISRVDALQQQQMAEAQKRRTELRLKQVANALKTFEDGDYGWCKKCGEAIGYRRLAARPESPCCVPCMSALER